MCTRQYSEVPEEGILERAVCFVASDRHGAHAHSKDAQTATSGVSLRRAGSTVQHHTGAEHPVIDTCECLSILEAPTIVFEQFGTSVIVSLLIRTLLPNAPSFR